MIKKGCFAFLLLSLLVACQPAGNEGSPKQELPFPQVEGAFGTYVDLFGQTQLPIQIKGCTLDAKGLTEFDGTVHEAYAAEYSFSYRQIPANGDYVATISLGAADCLLPILSTYQLSGEKIDEKTIAVGKCGTACGFSCEEFMEIKPDFSIFVSDTIQTAKCDEQGNVLAGTTERYVLFKSGRLLENGQIELSGERRIDLD